MTQVKSEGGARPESGGGPGTSPVHPFRHEAFFYASESELVAMVEPFVREGVEAGEDVLVAVDAPKGERLRKRLGPAAARVRFADLTQLGSNPARLIPLWRSFLDGVVPETPCRGVGESVHSARSRAELAECLIHESLVNLAFSHDEALWLMCPCDSTAVSPETLEHLRRSHPYVSDALGDRRQRPVHRVGRCGPPLPRAAPTEAGGDADLHGQGGVGGCGAAPGVGPRPLAGPESLAHLGLHPGCARGHREQPPARGRPSGGVGMG